MKTIIKTIAVLLVTQLAQAQNPIKIADITIPQNGQGELVIQYEFPSDGLYTGYSMSITLPDGISLMKNDKGKYIYTMGECHEVTHQLTINYNETNGAYSFGCISLESDPLHGTSGALLTLPVKTEGNLTAGSILQGLAQEVNFAKLDGQTDFFTEEVEFDITIGEPDDTRVLLYENSTTAPEAAEGVNVRVLRSINANVWSTICLPFAMTEEQTKEAFGEDVLLADFTGYDVTEDDDENIVGIKVNFEPANAIEANHPYIIMVSAPVTEFTVDGVDIDPVDGPCVSFGYETGRRPVVYHPVDFIGTYVADFDFYHDAQKQALFLNGNKFYYATENSQPMKAFRAYFDFDDVLTELEEASVKVLIDLYDEETGIDGIIGSQSNGRWYDLSGRNVTKPRQRGIYIQKGKKTLVK